MSAQRQEPLRTAGGSRDHDRAGGWTGFLCHLLVSKGDAKAERELKKAERELEKQESLVVVVEKVCKLHTST